MDKMTPSEQKAYEKANELFDYFQDIVYLGHKDTVIEIANKLCDETIEALNGIKGMGKIHKVKFWKNVKKYINEING